VTDELPYLWKSVDNKVLSPGGFSGCKNHTPPAVSPETAVDAVVSGEFSRKKRIKRVIGFQT
jgi:hypothetical protein